MSLLAVALLRYVTGHPGRQEPTVVVKESYFKDRTV
jgi:hypothetical protein